MSSPMVRTLAMIRGQGHYPWKVESYNSFSGRRNDLYRIIDLIYCIPEGVVGVQVCGSDFSSHVKKMLQEEKFNTRYWLKTTTNQLFLIGWRKLKHKRGGKLMLFKPRIAIIFLEKEDLKIKEVDYKWLRKSMV